MKPYLRDYNKGKREMLLVCLRHRDIAIRCECRLYEEPENFTWMFANKEEIAHWNETGEQPDYKKALYSYEEEEQPRKKKHKRGKKNA